MSQQRFCISVLLFSLLTLTGFNAKSAEAKAGTGGETRVPQSFRARGIVMELQPKTRTVVIRHEAISNYMAAMTMPFKVKDPRDLAGLSRGDEISFELHVTDSESWVDGIARTGTSSLPPVSTPGRPAAVPEAQSLLDYRFTNELGQAVSLNDFRGQALAITFFYTRCPVPEFCPRLSKNFQVAQQKLESQAGAPTNWHFLSISFDTEFDTPRMLKAYGDAYQYDPKHWSFLTGPPDKIGELARQSDVTYRYESGTINHDFRTIIIDTTGHVHMVFPMAGDLSDQIVTEIIEAAAVTNPPMAHSP